MPGKVIHKHTHTHTLMPWTNFLLKVLNLSFLHRFGNESLQIEIISFSVSISLISFLN